MPSILLFAAALLETAQAFDPVVHTTISERALAAHGGRPWSADATWLLEDVLARADWSIAFDGIVGDKDAGRYYLHQMWPDHGYAPEAHAAVVAELGLPGPRARLDDFIELSRRRFLDETEKLVRLRGGHVADDEVGQVIYALATLLHTEQDRKHREGNGDLPDGSEVLHAWHFARYPGQLVTDVFPGRAMRDRARDRSVALLERLDARMGTDADGLWLGFATFARAAWRPARAFRPSVRDGDVDFTMDHLFPRWPAPRTGPPPELWVAPPDRGQEPSRGSRPDPDACN